MPDRREPERSVHGLSGKQPSTRMSECLQISLAVCRLGVCTCFRALCCKGPPPARPEYDLVCIGLTGSGKTSLLSRLCSESPEHVVSTTGFSIKAVPFQNAVLNVKELGGADHIRKYWSRYYQGSQGVVFVLDSASSEGDLETARNELHSALQHPQLCTLPFLILASHQDKPAARSAQENSEEPAEVSNVSSAPVFTPTTVLVPALLMTRSSGTASVRDRRVRSRCRFHTVNVHRLCVPVNTSGG
ncbi:ADP-ribosylation factor-like protein 15 isoform X4 [Eptesicus fuscus]|uniref:ADP-ribosylation factor-like protein 15 isoform X4 n=1 Tax=Eptesicus fuscus TaxID=29078 RepID=UPI002403BBF9|nr:ADP-ribosylation factor-like protein 15 isoform X4 [Eptesicus fuscus]